MLLFPALLIAASFSGCHRAVPSAKDLTLDCQISPSPPKVGPAQIRILLKDEKTGQPVRNATVTLEGDMSHAGMTPVFGTAQEDGAGQYRGVLNWTMPGDWILLVKANLPDHRHIEKQIAVQNVETK